MKSKITLIYSLLLVCLSVTQTNAETSSSPGVRWLCSTEKARWQELATTNAATTADAIKLDPKTTFQTMDGFGGCFNELGWEALQAIPEDRREAALKELFAPEGANFTLGRAPSGSQIRNREIQFRVLRDEAFFRDGAPRRAAHRGQWRAIQTGRRVPECRRQQGAGVCKQDRPDGFRHVGG